MDLIPRPAPAAGPRTPSAAASLRTQLIVGSRLVEAWLAPIPLDPVRAALTRQADLLAPAKLVMSRGAGGLLVEIPRGRDGVEDCGRARETLNRVRSWLDGGPSEAEAAAPERPAPDQIEPALDALGWPWEPVDASAYRVLACGALGECRVEVRAHAEVVRVALLPIPLPARAKPIRTALETFILNTNGRLRYARLSLAPGVEGELPVHCDAVLPRRLASERTLRNLVESVVVARDLMLAPLRALCSEKVATRFLELHDPTGTVSSEIVPGPQVPEIGPDPSNGGRR